MSKFFQWPRSMDIDWNLSSEEQCCVSLYRREDVFRICVERDEDDESGRLGHVAIYVKDPTMEDGFDVLRHYSVTINEANNDLDYFRQYIEEWGDERDVSEEKN